MNKNQFYCILIVLATLNSCKSKNQNIPLPSQQPVHSFFPVTSFLKGQLHQEDSLSRAALKITTCKGKTDSLMISMKEVKEFTAPFFTPEIDSTNLMNTFTESSFLDQTVNAFTLTYSRKNDRVTQQRAAINGKSDSLTERIISWDVYIDPIKQSVQRVYILKEEVYNGNFQTRELTWKTDQWCKIVTIPQSVGQSADVKEEMVIWQH